jgi:glycosyltransferase involved in cell wall biosynthesis
MEIPFDKYEWKYFSTFYQYLKWIYKRLLTGFYLNNLRKSIDETINKYSRLRIITVSEHSRYSFIRFFPKINPSNIKVFYSPLTKYQSNSNDNALSHSMQKKGFFLMLSSGIWVKNSYRLAKAFDGIVNQLPNKDFKMVFTGYTLKRKPKLKNPDNFIFLGYIERPELESLIKNSKALIYPSLNEGFGYPPLEAMKYGIPVVCSALGPVFETCADLPLYFNPFSITDIQIKLLEIFYCEKYFIREYREKLIERYSYISNIQEKHKQDLIKLLIS